MWDHEQAKAIAARHAGAPGGLLPALHEVQHAFGHVPGEVVPLLAETFNLSRAEVRGVISFYKDFREQPPGRHVITLCRAEACQAVGARAVEAHLARRGLTPGATTNGITLDGVYCLGNCALGPAALVDGEPVGRLDPAKCDALLERLA